MITVLLVQPWTSDMGPIEAALRSGGFAARIRRADFEAALHAALARETFDVVVLDRETSGMTVELVRRACTTFGVKVPIVVLGSLATLADEIRVAIEPLRN